MKKFRIFFSANGIVHREGADHRYGSCDHIRKHFIPLTQNKFEIGDYRFCKNCLKKQDIQEKVCKLLNNKMRVDQVKAVKTGNKVYFEQILN